MGMMENGRKGNVPKAQANICSDNGLQSSQALQSSDASVAPEHDLILTPVLVYFYSSISDLK